MLVSGEAPVPPSWPLMSTTSAWALATPAATVPTPTSATSFTLMRALIVGALEVVDQLRPDPRWNRCRGEAVAK